MILRNLNRSSNGQRVCGTPYVGVPASAIPAGGAYPALGLNNVDAEDPPGTLYRVENLTWDLLGRLQLFEDTSFIYTPPSADFVGLIRGTARVFKNDVAAYDEPYQFAVGMTFVSADLVVSSEVVAPEQIVTAQLTASYTVHAMVARNLEASYSVLASVRRDLVASYAVQVEGQAVFWPSLARTIRVLPAPSTFESGGYWDMTDPKRPAGLKRQGGALDFSMDWAPWLDEIGAEVSGFAFFTDLNVLATEQRGKVFSIFVDGGVPGLRPITCRVTTTAPVLIEDRTIYLLITEN